MIPLSKLFFSSRCIHKYACESPEFIIALGVSRMNALHLINREIDVLTVSFRNKSNSLHKQHKLYYETLILPLRLISLNVIEHWKKILLKELAKWGIEKNLDIEL